MACMRKPHRAEHMLCGCLHNPTYGNVPPAAPTACSLPLVCANNSADGALGAAQEAALLSAVTAALPGTWEQRAAQCLLQLFSQG